MERAEGRALLLSDPSRRMAALISASNGSKPQRFCRAGNLGEQQKMPSKSPVGHLDTNKQEMMWSIEEEWHHRVQSGSIEVSGRRQVSGRCAAADVGGWRPPCCTGVAICLITALNA